MRIIYIMEPRSEGLLNRKRQSAVINVISIGCPGFFQRDSNKQRHSIESRLHIGGQFLAQALEIEICMKIRQNRPSRLQSGDPAECFRQAEMAWVSCVA